MAPQYIIDLFFTYKLNCRRSTSFIHFMLNPASPFWVTKQRFKSKLNWLSGYRYPWNWVIILLFSDDDSDSNRDSEQEPFCDNFHSTPKRSKESNSLQLRDPLTHCDSHPIALTCCRDNCLHSFSFVETQKAKSVFTSKSRLEQNQFLLDSSLMFFNLVALATNGWWKESIYVTKLFARFSALENGGKRLRKSRTLYYAGVTKAMHSKDNQKDSYQ